MIMTTTFADGATQWLCIARGQCLVFLSNIDAGIGAKRFDRKFLDPASPEPQSVPWPHLFSRRQWGGFGLTYGSDPIALGASRYGRVTVPLWFVTGVEAILCVRSHRRLRQFRARARAGLCRRCGYDLRAGGPVCPECGTQR